LPLVKGLLIEMQHKAYKHKSILSFRKWLEIIPVLNKVDLQVPIPKK
jgi:hypothetical protein